MHQPSLAPPRNQLFQMINCNCRIEEFIWQNIHNILMPIFSPVTISLVSHLTDLFLFCKFTIGGVLSKLLWLMFSFNIRHFYAMFAFFLLRDDVRLHFMNFGFRCGSFGKFVTLKWLRNVNVWSSIDRTCQQLENEEIATIFMNSATPQWIFIIELRLWRQEKL